jgi:hypothetical protein
MTNATSSSAAQCGLRNRRVAFCPSLRVILIPSRGEYKRAGLYGELWWASIDFLKFQAAANSEIRMLASYEGIGAKAARCKLYQPGANSIDPDEFLAFVGGGFSGNPFEPGSPASSAKPSPNASDENLDKKSNIVGDGGKESQAGRGGAGEDEAFGQFAETDGAEAEAEADEQPPFSPSPHQSHSATPPASSSFSTSSSSSSSSSSSRPRFGSSGSEDDAKGGGLDDDDESPQMVRVNSLDCVKSALRVPLPETLEEDGASIWTWDGKLKSPPSPSSSSSSSTLARRAGGGSTAALAAAAQKHDKSSSRLAASSSSSSSSQQPRGQEEHEFWRLCVSMDKPNGLNGERKSRFSCRSTNGGHESGVGFTLLVMWIGAFFVVAYLVLDSGSSAIHHDPSSTVTKM